MHTIKIEHNININYKTRTGGWFVVHHIHIYLFTIKPHYIPTVKVTEFIFHPLFCV